MKEEKGLRADIWTGAGHDFINLCKYVPAIIRKPTKCLAEHHEVHLQLTTTGAHGVQWELLSPILGS
jgi:hypothetical protein